MSDFIGVEVTNDARKGLQNEIPLIVNYLTGFLTLVLLIYTLSINVVPLAAIFTIFLIFLIVLTLLGEIKRSSKVIFYVVLKKKLIIGYDDQLLPGGSLTVFKSQDQKEAEDLALRIRPLLPP